MKIKSATNKQRIKNYPITIITNIVSQNRKYDLISERGMASKY